MHNAIARCLFLSTLVFATFDHTRALATEKTKTPPMVADQNTDSDSLSCETYLAQVDHSVRLDIDKITDESVVETVEFFKTQGLIKSQHEAKEIELALKYQSFFNSGLSFHAFANVLIERGIHSRKQAFDTIIALASPLLLPSEKLTLLEEARQWILTFLGRDASLKDILHTSIDQRAKLLQMRRDSFNDFVRLWTKSFDSNPDASKLALYLAITKNPEAFANAVAKALPRRRYWIAGSRHPILASNRKEAPATVESNYETRFLAYKAEVDRLNRLPKERLFSELSGILMRAYRIDQINSDQDILFAEHVRKFCLEQDFSNSEIAAFKKRVKDAQTIFESLKDNSDARLESYRTAITAVLHAPWSKRHQTTEAEPATDNTATNVGIKQLLEDLRVIKSLSSEQAKLMGYERILRNLRPGLTESNEILTMVTAHAFERQLFQIETALYLVDTIRLNTIRIRANDDAIVAIKSILRESASGNLDPFVKTSMTLIIDQRSWKADADETK